MEPMPITIAPTDTVDKINFELMAKRVKLVFYTAWEMANRNEMVKRNIPLQIIMTIILKAPLPGVFLCDYFISCNTCNCPNSSFLTFGSYSKK